MPPGPGTHTGPAAPSQLEARRHCISPRGEGSPGPARPRAQALHRRPPAPPRSPPLPGPAVLPVDRHLDPTFYRRHNSALREEECGRGGGLQAQCLARALEPQRSEMALQHSRCAQVRRSEGQPWGAGLGVAAALRRSVPRAPSHPRGLPDSLFHSLLLQGASPPSPPASPASARASPLPCCP